MIVELVKAACGMVAILGGWLFVQIAWRRTFGAPADTDVLAGRTSCHGCTCETPCEDEAAKASTTVESRE